jgi:hypothetical protein
MRKPLLIPTEALLTQKVYIINLIGLLCFTNRTVRKGTKGTEEEVESMRTENRENNEALRKIMLDFDKPITRMNVQLSTITDNLEKSKRLAIYKWISKIPYAQHHMSTRNGRLEGTGRWLLDDPQFIEWRKSSSSSMLWIHGLPGSGKSKLL